MSSEPSDMLEKDAVNKSSTSRFSDRVDNYVRARPSYPLQILEALQSRGIVSAGSRVADVGAGTGISSRMFVEAGCEVIAIEPNAPMRQAADAALSQYIGFKSMYGTAEHTMLPDTSVDLVVAAQAFHWFDRMAFRKECVRVLVPGGYVALIWNDRKLGGTPFLDQYETLLERFGTDYRSVNHRNIGDAGIAEFFAPMRYETVRCENVQRFDFEGLQSRLLSSSYAPNVGSPNADEMLAELKRIFDSCEQNGVVEMVYETQLFFGRLS